MRASLLIMTLFFSGIAASGVKAAESFQDPLSGSYLGQMFFGLAVVIALIFILSFAVKRYGQVGPASAVPFKVLTSLALSQRERLVLVQIGEQQVVLGVAPGHVSQIMALEEPLITEQHTGNLSAGSVLAADWLGRLTSKKTEAASS